MFEKFCLIFFNTLSVYGLITLNRFTSNDFLMDKNRIILLKNHRTHETKT